MSQLTYRFATLADFEDLYRIKCDKENIAWGGFTQAPERESFFLWYQRQLASDCRWIYLVYEGQKCCAFFYVDKLEDGTFEAVSSGVLSEFMGKGIGTYALAMQIAEIRRLSAMGKVFSWVSDKNIASYKRYEKLGFVRTGMSLKLETYHFSGANTNSTNGLKNCSCVFHRQSHQSQFLQRKSDDVSRVERLSGYHLQDQEVSVYFLSEGRLLLACVWDGF